MGLNGGVWGGGAPPTSPKGGRKAAQGLVIIYICLSSPGPSARVSKAFSSTGRGVCILRQGSCSLSTLRNCLFLDRRDGKDVADRCFCLSKSPFARQARRKGINRQGGNVGRRDWTDWTEALLVLREGMGKPFSSTGRGGRIFRQCSLKLPMLRDGLFLDGQKGKGHREHSRRRRPGSPGEP